MTLGINSEVASKKEREGGRNCGTSMCFKYTGCCAFILVKKGHVNCPLPCLYSKQSVGILYTILSWNIIRFDFTLSVTVSMDWSDREQPLCPNEDQT